jgi:hypothetical protein
MVKRYRGLTRLQIGVWFLLTVLNFIANYRANSPAYNIGILIGSVTGAYLLILIVRWLYRKIIDILIGSSVERSSDDNLTGLSEEDSSTNKPIEDIAGVGGKKADELRAAGYESVTDIQAASRTDLSRVNGIGNALAARIKKDAEDIKVETNPED